MPKQILRINDFSGGLNSSLDPRDIADNQVSKVQNARLNHLGRITILGNEELHEANTGIGDHEIAIPGEGLIHFKSDRHGAGHAGDILSQGGYNDFTHASWWTANGDFTLTTTSATFSCSGTSSADSYIQQASSAFDPKHPIANHQYVFEYEVMDLSVSDAADINEFYIEGGSGYFAAAKTSLNKNNGFNRTIFYSNANQADLESSNFRIVVESTATASFKIKQVSLRAVNLLKGNASYLLWRAYQVHMPDKIWEKNNIDETAGDAETIYKSFLNANPWGSTGVSVPRKMGLAHYSVDGCIRLSDTRFHQNSRTIRYLKYADTPFTLSDGDFTENSWVCQENHIYVPRLFWIKNGGNNSTVVNSKTFSTEHANSWESDVYAQANEGYQGGPGLTDHLLLQPGEGADTTQLALAGLRNVYRIEMQITAHNRHRHFVGIEYTEYPSGDESPGYEVIDEGDSLMNGMPTTEELYLNESFNTDPAWFYIAVGKATGDSQERHFVEDGLDADEGGSETGGTCSASTGNFLYYPLSTPNGIFHEDVDYDEDEYYHADIKIEPGTGSGTGDITKWALNETGQEVADEHFESSWDDGHSHDQTANDFVGIAIFTAHAELHGQEVSAEDEYSYIEHHQLRVRSLKISDTPIPRNLDDIFNLDGHANPKSSDVQQYEASRIAILSTNFVTSSHASGWQNSAGGHAWQFAISAVYEGGGESNLTDHASVDDWTDTDWDTQPLHPPNGGNGEEVPELSIMVLNPHYSDYDPRQTGWRLYAKDSGPSAASDDWFLQFEIDLKRNNIKSELTGYTRSGISASNAENANYSYITYSIDHTNNLSPSFGRTHREMSGIDTRNEESIHSTFRTATVLNRRVWIGNIRTQNVRGPFYDKEHPDAMIGSEVNAFDIFPSQKIDVASVMDGDEIIKLHSYNNKLLQFKTKKLHIFDMSDPDITTLERTDLHKGILFRSNACETEFGIVWANQHGVYIYDGEEIVDLTHNEGVQLIKIKSTGDYDSWEDFTLNDGTELKLDNMKYCQVGYDISNRQLVITGWGRYQDGTNWVNKATALYIFDFVTRSWTTARNILTDGNRTNMVNDDEGNLVWITDPVDNSPSSAKTWSSTTAATDNFVLRTKDYSFGDVGIKKKIYSINISYKGDASALNVKYAVNGETDFDDMYQFKNPDSGSGDDTPLANKTDLESWHTVKLVPTTSSQANNIYSFAVEFNGTAGADFELNDINIVYRKKNIV